jgi:CRISPR-associated protein Csx10
MTLTVTLRQRAQVGDRARSDFVVGTHDHLPGAVVRGAFAGSWLARHGGNANTDRATFLQLFEGGVRYGPLFHDQPPVPLSIVGHKYPASDDCDFSELDQALSGDAPTRCPTCDSPLETPRLLGAAASTPTSRRTSVAISSSGVAQRSQIVTRDTVDAGLAFRGHLVADASLLDELADLAPLRVGGRRTTHGRADVVIDTGQGEQPQLLDDGRIILRLRSPGVFVDDSGRPSRDPNPAELAEVLKTPVSVVRRWTRWVTVGGWHAASGLPKPVELAVTAGSTYVLAPENPVPAETLQTLGRRGLGLRRHEGFGDLGGAPTLTPDRAAREAEERRRTDLGRAMFPLQALKLRENVWPEFLDRVGAYLDGEVSGAQVRSATPSVNTYADEALDRLLTAAAADVTRILEGWRAER